MRIGIRWVPVALGAAMLLSSVPSRELRAAGGERGEMSAVGAMGARRSSHTATLLLDGRVLVAGGMERNGVFLSSAEVFDPLARRFTPVGEMSAARVSATATRLVDGRVLIAGGGGGRTYQPLASAELFEPAAGRFQPTARLLTPRSGAQAVRLADGRVLVVGGSSESDSTYLASAELYDPSTGRFSATGSMHTPRVAFAICALGDGRVLVAGGSVAGRYPNREITPTAELYDPRSGAFETAGSMAVPRHKLACATLPDGRVLVVGGSDNRDWRGKYASAELYDPATRSFSPAGDMHEARFKLTHAIVMLPDGRVLVAGGAGNPELFDARTRRFELVACPALDGRYFSTATRLLDGRVLLAGGYGERVEPSENAAWLFRL
jgi:Kelch motif protein